MGQKVHPIGFRLGVIRSWDSKWFEEKNYAQWLHEDIKIREHVKKSLNHAGVSKVEIERRRRQRVPFAPPGRGHVTAPPVRTPQFGQVFAVSPAAQEGEAGKILLQQVVEELDLMFGGLGQQGGLLGQVQYGRGRRRHGAAVRQRHLFRQGGQRFRKRQLGAAALLLHGKGQLGQGQRLRLRLDPVGMALFVLLAVQQSSYEALEQSRSPCRQLALGLVVGAHDHEQIVGDGGLVLALHEAVARLHGAVAGQIPLQVL